jgi:hypothetical protein
MRLRLVFLFFVSAFLSSEGLKMTQDAYEAYGEPGSITELICKADELPDQCTFTR